MKLILFLVTIGSFINVSNLYSLTIDIEGIYVSTTLSEVYEFDIDRNFVMIEKLYSKKVDVFEFKTINDQIIFTNDSLTYSLNILHSDNNLLHLNFAELDLDIQLYKANFDFEIDSIKSDLVNNLIDVTGTYTLNGIFTGNNLIKSISGVTFNNSDTWSFSYYKGLPILHINAERYLVLGKNESGFTLGNISSEYESSNLQIKKNNFTEKTISGTWRGRIKYDSNIYPEVTQLKFLIIDNTKGILQANSYNQNHYQFFKVNHLPQMNAIEILGDSYLVFKIVETSTGIELIRLHTTNLETRHKLGRFVNEKIEIVLKKECD